MSLAFDALKLTTLPQKLLVGGLGAALVATAAFSTVKVFENQRLSSEISALDTRINDPRTGYVVKLTQAQTNVEVCKTAVTKQTDAIKALGIKDAARVAAVQARYDTEHAARIRAESSAATILAHKPQGDTLTERMNDVDAQILGDLK